LSPPSVASWNEYPVKAGGVNRHIVWYTPARIRRLTVWCWMPGCRPGQRRSAPTYGKRQRIRDALRRCAIQIHIK